MIGFLCLEPLYQLYLIAKLYFRDVASPSSLDLISKEGVIWWASALHQGWLKLLAFWLCFICAFLIQFMRFQLMKNNLQWFQSPRPNSLNFSHAHQHQEQFPDLSHVHPNNLTPTSIVHHPLSPFIPLNPPERHEINALPQPYTEQIKGRGINQLVVFSEEEDDQRIQSPHPHLTTKIHEDLMTTGRKSSTEKSLLPKKSRPKDKGLRGLSLKALNTVLLMRQGTYKQVATKLLASLQEDAEAERPPNEQTNIKRRVYDALNVLISLGLLTKQGRMIVGQKSPQMKKKEEMKERDQLREKLEIKEFILSQKRKKLAETHEKLKGIQKLFDANCKNYEAVQSANTFIPFPFVGVLAISSQWRLIFLSDEELEMRFKQLVHPFGDIDSLRQLQHHST